MARHRHAKWKRRSQNAKTPHSARIIGLGTAAGATLTFGMTPLASVAPAHADLIDFFIDPIIDPLSGAVATATSSLGDVGAANADASESVAGVLGGLDSALATLTQDLNTAVDEIAQGYLASPIGHTLDPIINAAATLLLGHDLIDDNVVTVTASTNPDGLAVSSTQTAAGSESATQAALAYTVTSQWDGGFVADYTIANPGATPLTDWKLEFDLPADDSIVSVWNAQLTQSGTQYVLTPESYDSTIAPDGSATIGFQVTDTGPYAPPTHVTIDGQPADTSTTVTSTTSTGTTGTTGTSTGTTGTTGTSTTSTGTTGTSTTSTGTTGTTGTSTTGTGPDETINGVVTSEYDGGFVTEYTITNTGTTPISNWNLEFDLPKIDSITNIWNATYSVSGSQYTMTPESYNTTIDPGQSVDFGFQGTDAGSYTPPTQVTFDGHQVDTGTTSTGTTSTGTTSTGTTSTGTTSTGTSGEEFSPYFDVTLYPAFNYSSAADAGIKDATLAFIVADSQDQPAWGGFSAYAVDGGSDISYINSQISAMKADGISPTISFGGENGTYLADIPGQTVSGLENDYLQVINTYDIHRLDFDIEGAELSNTSALTLQAQALAAVEAKEAADGTPLTVSYTLPVLPTGLTASGLEPLELAKEYGVDVNVVNIMAMDYGGGFDGSGDPNMGELAIEAAQNTHSQLMQLYPDLSSAQAWSMVGVTPLIGINDDPAEIFTLADAQQLTDFAIQNRLGELSMWAGNKDVEGTLGATDQLDGSGIAQAPWAFSKIFEQFAE